MIYSEHDNVTDEKLSRGRARSFSFNTPITRAISMDPTPYNAADSGSDLDPDADVDQDRPKAKPMLRSRSTSTGAGIRRQKKAAPPQVWNTLSCAHSQHNLSYTTTKSLILIFKNFSLSSPCKESKVYCDFRPTKSELPWKHRCSFRSRRRSRL